MMLEMADYIIKTHCTVREAAKHFNLSKTTVHYLMAKRLPKVSVLVANKVAKVLAQNKAERHIRGGEATRRKYVQRNKNSNI